MKLMIVGAGPLQVNAIKRARDMGISVVASDYRPDSIGKSHSDFCVLADAFDAAATTDAARSFAVDGIMTVGTDQPVLTVAKASQALGLACPWTVDTALLATNKKHMKNRFEECSIPSVPFRIIGRGFSDEELDGLRTPLVVKPLDSQGQRGIFKLQRKEQVREMFEHVIKHSRADEIIVEEYYESSEVTVSGWALNGKAHVLTITDRVCFEDENKIGICTSHEFPSMHMKSFGDEIIEITQDIVDGFGIKNGPLYFQMLIGAKGVKVNEIACRIGGAYEDISIPLITGVDILGLNIDISLGKSPDYSALLSYDIKSCAKKMSVQLFFAKPGKIESLTHLDEVLSLDGVCFAGYNFSKGDVVPSIQNATQRAGFAGVLADDEKSLSSRLEALYESMSFTDNFGDELILRGKSRHHK